MTNNRLHNEEDGFHTESSCLGHIFHPLTYFKSQEVTKAGGHFYPSPWIRQTSNHRKSFTMVHKPCTHLQSDPLILWQPIFADVSMKFAWTNFIYTLFFMNYKVLSNSSKSIDTSVYTCSVRRRCILPCKWLDNWLELSYSNDVTWILSKTYPVYHILFIYLFNKYY